MYPSDHYLVYANGVDAVCYGELSECKSGSSGGYGTPSANWIYNSNELNWNCFWFVTPFSNRITALAGFPGGFPGSIDSDSAVRPVLYLSSNVKITDGTGEQNNPYKLGL